MNETVMDLAKVSDKVKAATPVEINGRKHYVDLRPLHYAYLRATCLDGSPRVYLGCPDGHIEKDDCSLIEGFRDAV